MADAFRGGVLPVTGKKPYRKTPEPMLPQPQEEKGVAPKVGATVSQEASGQKESTLQIFPGDVDY